MPMMKALSSKTSPLKTDAARDAKNATNDAEYATNDEADETMPAAIL